MKIAMIQMKVIEKNKDVNVEHGLALAEEAAKQSEVIVMPEIWTTGYSLGQLAKNAEDPNGKVVTELQRIAREQSCNIVAGSVPMKLEGKIYNTSLAISAQGEVVDLYNKIHLFGMFKEENFFAAGNKYGVYEFDGVTCANTICYDLRFPELYRSLALQGAKVIFVPAEWPEVRGAAWRLLLQARAVENQLFICGVNCVGTFKDTLFYGHSMLVAPTGEISLEGGREEEILITEIDLAEINKARNSLDALKDARTDLFGV